MAEKVLMISLSPTMEQGTIAIWNKKVGDKVEEDDVLCEVETDKASMEYESTVEGTLLKIMVEEGDQAAVGDLIAIVGEEGEDIESIIQSTQISTSSTPKVKDIEPKPVSPAQNIPETQASSQSISNRDIKISPLARKIAQSKGLNLNAITGSGPGGRIIKRDVEQLNVVSSTTVDIKASPVTSTSEDLIIPLTVKKRVTAEKLSESKFSAPHYYVKNSIEMDGLISGRSSLNKSIKNTKISFNSFLIKLVAETLKSNRAINAGWNNDSIIQFGRIDIAIAVATDEGLITPVIRDVANKGIVQIEEELKVLIDKAMSNSLALEEFTNSTFTISNLGSFGIEEFTAIVNPPGSAILAIGETKRVQVVGDDDVVSIKSMMKASLSCDHRVIDGKDAALFMKKLKEIIECPLSAFY